LGGTTGVVVRLASTGGTFGDRIEFENDEDDTPDGQFVLDSSSDHYVSTSSGGLIADGLLGWYVDRDHHDGTDLVSAWGPGAYNAANVVTGAQNAFDSGMGIVEDHVYAGQFSTPGGGGADLPVTTEASVTPAAIGATNIGVWAKVSGDHSDTDSSVTIDPPGVTLDTSISENSYSFIVGADIVPTSTNFRVGAFGGYTGAQADFGGADAAADYTGGTVGVYGAYNNGSFYADVTGKADLLAVTYNYGGSSADATATNLGVNANVGYRVQMGQMFIEPIGSAQVVNTQVSSISGVDFENSTSVRLGAGGRIGTQIASGDLTTEISLLGKVWDELGGANTAMVDDGNGQTMTSTSDTGGISGQLSASATVWSSDKGLSGFVSADSKFGESSMSYGGKIGVRAGF
jgi:hypothetical protein